MVIFHSYVKLPEGKIYDDFKQGGWSVYRMILISTGYPKKKSSEKDFPFQSNHFLGDPHGLWKNEWFETESPQNGWFGIFKLVRAKRRVAGWVAGWVAGMMTLLVMKWIIFRKIPCVKRTCKFWRTFHPHSISANWWKPTPQLHGMQSASARSGDAVVPPPSSVASWRVDAPPEGAVKAVVFDFSPSMGLM